MKKHLPDEPRRASIHDAGRPMNEPLLSISTLNSPSSRLRGGLIAGATVLFIASPAFAQGAPPGTTAPGTTAAPQATVTAAGSATPQQISAAADAAYEEGQALVAKGDYNAACVKFEESLRLDPSDSTLFNLADCEERRNHLRAAVKRWRESLAWPNLSEEDKAMVQKRLLDAEKKAAHLVIRLPADAAAGTAVKVDEEDISPTELSGPVVVDPGDHKVTVTAPGRRPSTVNVSPKAGESPGVEIVPGPPIEPPKTAPSTSASATGAPVATSIPTGQPPTEQASSRITGHSLAGITRHPFSWSLLAVGGGLTAGAIAVGAEILSTYPTFAPKCLSPSSTCAQSEIDAMRARERNANILVGAAIAAGVGAAAVYFLFEGGPFERPEKKAASLPKVGVLLGPTSATLDVRF